ncbi:MAG TPA: acyltransferase [Rhizobacter sp.]|nr:acyltransferase [Rhizobacter sp.]
MNALRGLAALLVVFSHLAAFTGYGFGPDREGHFGVMLFFTLSGFLMGLLYLGQPAGARQVAGYAVARFSRIAPPYLIVVLLSFAIYTLVDPGFPYAIDRHNLLRHLFFSGNVSVLWSIPPEVQFYALFIALWWAVQRAQTGRGAGALIAVLGLAVIAICLRDAVPGTFVSSKLQYFLMGAMVGWLHPRLLRAAPVSTLALTLLQAAMLASLLLFMVGAINLRADYWLDLAPALVCGLAVYAFSHDRTAIEAALAARPLQWLGDWSFSLYLLHVPVLYLLGEAGLPRGSALSALIGVSGVLLATAAFSVGVEHPACAACKRRLTAWLRPRSVAPTLARDLATDRSPTP